MKKIILIDGNSLMFRSYYATAYSGSLLQNKQGLYTNAIFGFVNMVSKLLEQEHDYVFVAFDKGKNTFRHQQYDDYKGGRKPMPDEFRVQIPYIKEYLDLLNIKHVEVDEYEADDLIASVSELAKNSGLESMVVTGDKDLLQLVSDHVTVNLTKKGVGELEEYNTSNFFELMGINPLQVPDYKGLIGDSSDNLPGIKGIGPKTATSLLAKYNTLEGVFESVDEVKGKTHDLLVEGKDTGLKCKELATLVRNIKLDFTLDDLEVKAPNAQALLKFLEEMECYSIIKRMDLKKGPVELENAQVSMITRDTTFSNNVTIDVEMFGETYYKAIPLSLSILDNDKYYFIPFAMLSSLPNVINMLQNSNIKKNVYDYKKIKVLLKRNDIAFKGLDFDLMLGIYIVNPSFANDDISVSVSNFNTFIPLEEEVYGKGAKASIPENQKISDYAYQKCKVINSLKDTILETISNNEASEIYNTELKLADVLGEMELGGLLVDQERLSRIGNELKEKMSKIESKIYEEAGEEFNINSVKQLGEILFEKLSLPHGKRNKTGYSTSSDILEKLAPIYPIAQDILDYRACAKLISTYVEGLKVLIDEDSMIHPLYKQALTATGRLSSVEPNIQNMPIRTELGKVIRDIFVSRYDGGKILSCDYSQIELRVLSHIANDENMINMFNSGADFHTSTAAEVFDVPVSEVTKEMRRNAKAINFGIVYGMSAWGLSEQLGIAPGEAASFISKYFSKFPKIKEYLDNTVNNAIENKYTKTLFNRVRYIPELSSSNKALQEFGKRTAMNAPIQGSAADIIKIAMVNIYNRIKGMKSKMIAQVHDELVFDCANSELEEVKNIVINEMENAVKLRVKLIAEPEVGDSWLKE